MEWVPSTLDIGGHRIAGIRQPLRARLGDPVAAGLMGRFLRGDCTVAPAPSTRLFAVRAQ